MVARGSLIVSRGFAEGLAEANRIMRTRIEAANDFVIKFAIKDFYDCAVDHTYGSEQIVRDFRRIIFDPKELGRLLAHDPRTVLVA
jgi:hypothetical protein